MRRRRRPGGRHAPHTILHAQSAVSDALWALWAMDVGAARMLLGRLPADTVARQLLPAVEALWAITADRARDAPALGGDGMSPACSAGYCYADIPCYVLDCPHKCHQPVASPVRGR